MARTQKNKATNYHLGTLKAKLAKLRSELLNGPGGKSAGTKNAERGFDVTKSGDTRIGLVGFPSVGKSTLLTTLTGTRSEAVSETNFEISFDFFSACKSWSWCHPNFMPIFSTTISIPGGLRGKQNHVMVSTCFSIIYLTIAVLPL